VLPGDRPADAVAFEAAVVDFFVDAADLLGVPKSVAAIYGIVFASPEPLSFADIAARLDISKGSISQGLRVLREVGALIEAPLMTEDRRQMTDPGKSESALRPPPSVLGRPSSTISRQSSALSPQPSSLRTASRYYPDLALRRLVARFLENRLGKQLDAGKARLVTLKKAVPAGRNGNSKLLRDRVAQLESWNSKARALLPVARTFLKLTPI
jgi:DNA-binding transcriptional ArsR family regulator